MQNSTLSSIIISILNIAIVTVFVAMTIFVWLNQLYHYDGIENIYNAFCIGNSDRQNYNSIRTPLLPLFYAPLLRLNMPFATTIKIIGIISLLLAAMTAVLAYRFYRRYFQQALALFLVFLLLTNRLVLHFMYEPMSDIPATLITLAMFLCYFSALERNSQGYMLATGAVLGLAICTRYNMLIFVGILGIGLTIRCYAQPHFSKKSPAKFITTLSLMMITAFVVAFFLYYSYYYLLLKNASKALASIFSGFYANIHGVHWTYADTPYEYLLYIAILCNVLLIFLIWGGWHSRTNFTREPELFLAGGIFLAAMSVFTHKEARYLLPILPIIYYFIGVGISRIPSLVNTQNKLLVTATVIICLASPVYNIGMEIYTLQEPMYQDDFVPRVARHIEQQGKDLPVYTIGAIYGIYPQNYPACYHFSIYDEFYHFYHLDSIFSLYSGKEITPIFESQGFTRCSVIYSGKVHPVCAGARDLLGKEAIVIYNSPHLEMSISNRIYDAPLIIARVRTEKLALSANGLQAKNFTILRKGNSLTVTKGQFPFEIYRVCRDKPIFVGLVVNPHEIWTIFPFADKFENKIVPRRFTMDLLADFSQNGYEVSYQEITRFYRHGASGSKPGRSTSVY